MTDPASQGPAVAAGPGPAPAMPAGPTSAGPPPQSVGMPTGSVTGQAVPLVPDDAVMIREIDRDRRHERYLLRAALVACIVIGIALTIRMVWG